MEFFQEKVIGVGGHFLQGIFLTQGLNLSLLHCRQSLYHLSHQGFKLNVLISPFFFSHLLQSGIWDLSSPTRN